MENRRKKAYLFGWTATNHTFVGAEGKEYAIKSVKSSTEAVESSAVCYSKLEGWARGQIQEEEVITFLGRARHTGRERVPSVDPSQGSRNGYGKPLQCAMQSSGDSRLAHGPGLLCGINGAKEWRKEIQTVFGRPAVVQRSQGHKRKNVVRDLPKA